MESFWAASTVYVNDVKYEFSFPETVHPENFTNSSGLRYQAKQVRKCIKEGKIQSEIMSHEDSLLLASICDQIRKQIGVHYYEDD